MGAKKIIWTIAKESRVGAIPDEKTREFEFRQAVKDGLTSLNQGRRVPLDEARKRMAVWISKYFSDQALSDLERMVAVTAVKQPEVARWFGNHLLDTAMSLAALLKCVHAPVEFRTLETSEVVVLNCRIIYRVNTANASVEIVRFWQGADCVPQMPHLKTSVSLEEA